MKLSKHPLKLFKNIHGLALLVLTLPLLLLADYAIMYIYARNATITEAKQVISQVHSGLLDTDGKLDTRKLLNDVLPPYPYIVVTENGQIIDRSNIAPGIFDAVDYEAAKQYTKPTNVQTTPFTYWRLLSFPVYANNTEIGLVFVGTYIGDQANAPAEIDSILANAAKQIGGLLIYKDGEIDTNRIKVRDINPFVSAYAIITKNGKILPGEYGALPSMVLKTDINNLKNNLAPRIISSGNDTYLSYGQMIKVADSNLIIATAMPFTETKRLLDLQAWVVLGLLSILIIIAAAPLARRVYSQDGVTLAEALRRGEGQDIEFKSALPAGNALAKHIAGFANSGGGTLFIGIDDNRKVIGLEQSLEIEQKWKKGFSGDKLKKGMSSFDKILLAITNDIRSLISPAPELKADIVKYKQLQVLRLIVPKGREPIYSVSGAIYIRHGNQTVPAKSEEILRLVRGK